MILVDISGANAAVRRQDTLTCGMGGARVGVRFDEQWEGLAKTGVFHAGGVTRDVVLTGEEAQIPHEVLTVPGVALRIGVYGTDGSGTLVIPTVWAQTAPIAPGADPSGDPGAEPTLPVWAQLREQVHTLAAGQPRLVMLQLPTSGWQGSGNLWSQRVLLADVADKQVNLLPSVSQLVRFRDWQLNLLTENDGGTVTVYAMGPKPQEDIAIQASVTEVFA